jgi:glycerophosphoryl diester phosphodiesterase
VHLFRRKRFGLAEGTLPPWVDMPGPGVHLLRDDPEWALRWQEQGRDIYCWTVDRPADVALCSALGVRYVATNSPAATRRLLAG